MYLKHHGILGQKWGKRNGPPYPLDADDHSTAEKNTMNNHPDRGGDPKESYNPDKSKAPEIKKQKFKFGKKEKEPFNKEKAIKNVDIRSVYKHRKEFEDKEFKAVLERFNTEKKYKEAIKELDDKKKKEIIKFLEGNTKNIEIANKTLSEIAKLADNLAKFIPKSK